MTEAPSFQDLIHRVRRGDEHAANQLVRDYEPYIRRSLRAWLKDSWLRRHLDSVDICQLVLTSFFVRARLGQYELDGPGQLVALLLRMAKNKLKNEAVKYKTLKRDPGVLESMTDDLTRAHTPNPSCEVEAKDLLQKALRRMSPEERRILELREQDWEWAAVADDMGGTPDGRRKQWERAVARIAQELQLDE